MNHLVAAILTTFAYLILFLSYGVTAKEHYEKENTIPIYLYVFLAYGLLFFIHKKIIVNFSYSFIKKELIYKKQTKRMQLLSTMELKIHKTLNNNKTLSC